MSHLGHIGPIVFIVKVVRVAPIAIKDALVTVEHGGCLPPTRRVLSLKISDLLKLTGSILDFSLLSMRRFLNLSRFDRFKREKVTRHVVLDSNIWCMFHLLKVLEAASFEEVHVFF